MIDDCIQENARVAQNQEEYSRRYQALVDRFETAKAKLEKIDAEKRERAFKRNQLSLFLAQITERDGLLDTFDEPLWCATVESVNVCSERDIVIIFKDGTDIRVDVCGQ